MTITSESNLIQTYLVPLTQKAPGTFGLTDDAAVIPVPDGHELVITTDAIAAGVHFFPEDSPRDIAWKALAVNVSDLIAKGAVPLAYQMALSFPETPSADWMRDFAGGLKAAQTKFGMYLSGGDTDKRPGPLTIIITAMGLIPKGRMIRRSTASSGDRVYVSGTVGDSALGLMIRQDAALAKALKLSDEQQTFVLQRYLRPEPRIALREALLANASAAMDISDGLAQDLGKLAAASGSGALIETSRLPLSSAATAALSQKPELIARIICGGDDYEVLACIPPARTSGFETTARAAHVTVREIGVLRPDREIAFTDARGRTLVLGNTGWDHFQKT